MSFPQIGVEAVLIIEKFQRNAERYQRELDALEKRTHQASQSMTQSFQALRGTDNGWSSLRKSILDNQAAMDATSGSTQSLLAKFGMLSASVGVVTGTFALAGKAIRELIESGEVAAQVEDVRRSYVSLAASSGVSAEKLLDDLRRVSRGTVDTSSLIQTANRALLASGGQIANELPRLYEIASAAARATGQNVDYVFTTLVKGIIKGSPLLIDNAEVYIQIGNAVEQYATSLGKTTEQLTAQERTQATLNAVLAQGSDFIERAGAAGVSATDAYNRLNTQWEAFSIGMKTLVAPAADYVARSLQGLLFALEVVIAGVSAATKVFQNFTSNAFSIVNAGEKFKEEFSRTFDILQTGMQPVQDIQSGIRGIGNAAQEATDKADELNKKLADLETQRAGRLADIEKQLNRQLEDSQIQRARQLEDASIQLSRRLEDMAADRARRRAEIERSYGKTLSALNEKHGREWTDFANEFARKREEIERTHQDRLYDIRQRAMDDISEAVRRNDAVEVARAIRGQKRAERDEETARQREGRDLSISEEQKRQALLESQMQQRADAQRDYEQRLADLVLNEQQQQEQLRISLARQAEDRALAWARQEEDFQRNKARRLADLDAWYAEEQAKLGAHLDTQTQIAVQKVTEAGGAIASAATNALAKISESIVYADQIVNRGNYLSGGRTSPTTTSAAWRNRHRYFAAGGAMIADRPTTVTFGEAGRELGIFIPERKMSLVLGGRANIGFDGIPAGLSMSQVQDLVYRTIAALVERNLR